MEVLFKNTAFIKGIRYKRAETRDDFRDFPDELADMLPGSVKIKKDGRVVTMDDLRGDTAGTMKGMREASSANHTMAEALEQARDKELEEAFDDDDEEEAAPVVVKPAKAAKAVKKPKAAKKKAAKKK